MVEEQTVSSLYEEDVYTEPQSAVDIALHEETLQNEKAAEKTRIADLVQATLRGEYGFGQARKEALGQDYDIVQQTVKGIRLQNGTRGD